MDTTNSTSNGVIISREEASRLHEMSHGELAKLFNTSTDVVRMMGKESFIATQTYDVAEE